MIDDVPLVSIGDVCDVRSGGTPARNTVEYFRGEILWVTIGDMKKKYILDTKEKINQTAIDNSNAKLMPSGTVLISIFATLGEVSILKIPATTNQAIAGLIPDKKKIRAEYLYYILKRKKEEIENLGRGVAQKNINLTILKNLKIPLPSMKVQDRIIERTTKIEELISLRLLANDVPDKIIRSAYIELFGNLSIEESKFPVQQLGKVAEISMGGTPDTKKSEYWKNGTVNWMKSGDIKEDFITTIPQRITILGQRNSNAKMYKKGDIVIALNGQGKTRATVGILTVETTSNQSVASISPSQEILTIYLYYNLKYRYQELRDLTGDKQRSGLNLTLLRNLYITIPPIELQEKFSKIVLQMQMLKKNQKDSTLQIQQIYNSMIQQVILQT